MKLRFLFLFLAMGCGLSCAQFEPIPLQPDCLLMTAAELQACGLQAEDPNAQLQYLATFYGDQAVLRTLREDRKQSWSAAAIKRMLEAEGWQVRVFRGQANWQAPLGLGHQLREGFPVLVLLAVDTDESATWQLALGYAREPKILIVPEVNQGLIGIPWKQMEEAWKKSGQTAILAIPNPQQEGWE